MIDNVDQMQSSTAAARSYKAPLKFAHMELLKKTILAGRRTMCTGCPSCAAFAKQTDFAFHDIARFVTYYEQDGNTDARDFIRRCRRKSATRPRWISRRSATAAISRRIIPKSSAAPKATSPDCKAVKKVDELKPARFGGVWFHGFQF
jgi:hypothetical protein